MEKLADRPRTKLGVKSFESHLAICLAPQAFVVVRVEAMTLLSHTSSDEGGSRLDERSLNLDWNPGYRVLDLLLPHSEAAGGTLGIR